MPPLRELLKSMLCQPDCATVGNEADALTVRQDCRNRLCVSWPFDHLDAFTGPTKQEVDMYSVSLEGAFEGPPVKIGRVTHCIGGELAHDVVLALYLTAFQLRPPGAEANDAGVMSYPWTPFTVADILHHTDAGFCFNSFDTKKGQVSHNFSATGTGDGESRMDWLHAVRAQLQKLTASLFPPHTIKVAPVPYIGATTSRIMAGYLLCTSAGGISLVYAQLGIYFNGAAPMELFTDEGCTHLVMTIPFEVNTSIGTYTGVHSNIFELGLYRFCARTPEEREIWVRALGNTKVKLFFQAPNPSLEELGVYRAAVQECVLQAQPRLDINIDKTVSALLPAKARAPVPAIPCGDVRYPVPAEIFSPSHS